MASEKHKVEIPYGTKDWVNRLARKEMPALAHSVQHLNGLTASDEACVAELAAHLLRRQLRRHLVVDGEAGRQPAAAAQDLNAIFNPGTRKVHQHLRRDNILELPVSFVPV